MDKFDILSFATLTPRDRTANQAIRFVVVQLFRWNDNKTGLICFFAVQWDQDAARLDFFSPKLYWVISVMDEQKYTIRENPTK